MSYICMKQVDEVIKKLYMEPTYQHEGEDFYVGVCTVAGNISELPVVDLQEVKRGTWCLETDEEEPNPMFKLVVCSACEGKSNTTYKFCPNCGADMRGENINA